MYLNMNLYFAGFLFFCFVFFFWYLEPVISFWGPDHSWAVGTGPVCRSVQDPSLACVSLGENWRTLGGVRSEPCRHAVDHTRTDWGGRGPGRTWRGPGKAQEWQARPRALCELSDCLGSRENSAAVVVLFLCSLSEISLRKYSRNKLLFKQFK